MPSVWPFRRRSGEVSEATVKAGNGSGGVQMVARPPTVTRSGYEHGIPRGGLSEHSQGSVFGGGQDRRSLMSELYQAFLACPWSWASTNAIARRITAGDLQLEWDAQDGEEEAEKPDKPAEVLALERLLRFCNPRENIRQLIRGVVADLLVFGDAFLEVCWIGSQPVALFSLDSPSTMPIANEHGEITGYVQVTEAGQRAEFEPRDVIHISLDSPRSGVFGVSPTFAALLPITSWLFTAAVLKETFRKGNPPNIHVDLPAALQETEVELWVDKYMTLNIGPKNIGRPIVTQGGGVVKELRENSIAELLQVLDQKRDEILATYGVPPAKVGVIESGNIGGGTGESQDKTFDVTTCDPISALILDALDYSLVQEGFGITGWKLGFGDIDWRDSDVVENIREKRLHNGAWSLNRYRSDIGEPTTDGGDEPMIMLTSGSLVRVKDIDTSAKAEIAAQLRGADLEITKLGDEDTPMELGIKEPEPVPDTLGPYAPGGAGRAGTQAAASAARAPGQQPAPGAPAGPPTPGRPPAPRSPQAPPKSNGQARSDNKRQDVPKGKTRESVTEADEVAAPDPHRGLVGTTTRP
jgi:hypothetical protein